MMFDEKSSLTKAIGKTKKVFRTTNYGSTNGRKNAGNPVYTKQKYQKFKTLGKIWPWRSSANKTKEELLEEGPTPTDEQKNVTIVTYAFCFIMMLAGLSVKMD